MQKRTWLCDCTFVTYFYNVQRTKKCLLLQYCSVRYSTVLRLCICLPGFFRFHVTLAWWLAGAKFILIFRNCFKNNCQLFFVSPVVAHPEPIRLFKLKLSFICLRYSTCYRLVRHNTVASVAGLNDRRCHRDPGQTASTRSHHKSFAEQ